MAIKDLVGHMTTTSQTSPIPGREQEQVKNAAGGYVFRVDDWGRLRRFLVLGSEGGTYYAGERELTLSNADCVRRCLLVDGLRVVTEIVDVSDRGLAPRNDACILALAIASKFGDDNTRRSAYRCLSAVCRTGTHLFSFVEARQALGGWGRGFRESVARWYNRDDNQVAYQLVKYRQRNGWTHRDLLRLAHPKHRPLLSWAAGKRTEEGWDGLPDIIRGFEQAQHATDPLEIVRLIEQHNIPWECVPSTFAKNLNVQEALLHNMPITAMIRQLGRLTELGLLVNLSDASKTVVDRVTSQTRLKSSRVHPMAVFLAMKTYASGHGLRGSGHWVPVQKIVDALDDAFYLTMENVVPTNKNILLGIDISGSMQSNVSGYPVSAREAAVAMAMIVAKTEPNHVFLGVTERPYHLPISPKMRVHEAVYVVDSLARGEGTDLSIPAQWANDSKSRFDAILQYTDSETWAGLVQHPAEAIQAYRLSTNIPTREVVCQLTATGTSISDPTDTLSLNCVGLSSDTPSVINNFITGEF